MQKREKDFEKETFTAAWQQALKEKEFRVYLRMRGVNLNL